MKLWTMQGELQKEILGTQATAGRQLTSHSACHIAILRHIAHCPELCSLITTGRPRSPTS
eukprot:5762613-Amphidinium_carterae.1